MPSYIPENMPQIMAYITVSTAEKALDFYEKAFGFSPTEEVVKDDHGIIQHARMQFESVHIMFGPENSYGRPSKTPKSAGCPPSLGLYIYCKDVDALYKQAIAAGAISEMEPDDMFWGDRMCKVKDPDGYEWSFATHLGFTAMAPCSK